MDRMNQHVDEKFSCDAICKWEYLRYNWLVGDPFKMKIKVGMQSTLMVVPQNIMIVFMFSQ